LGFPTTIGDRPGGSDAAVAGQLRGVR